ncbi:fatty acyl-CoA reductase wat-like [Homalodisca vitripennis]|uniref:fatty acyl-CoA reductase wat-like n=1 Tax=Homalodisca vitripennis TaxID=197043 RepID=UPI001EECC171|nr:fatty acyl-CoA reductase wat-like [Homalodisca vitripennis]
MALNEDSVTPIQDFYRGATVLITGGTGFLGKVLIEKLLRSCPHISQILLLIRSKRDINSQVRLEAMMDDPILKGVSDKNRIKVMAISGDCTLPGLGLSEANKQFLLESVTVVFHVAATVRFDEDLSTAVSINVVGTKAILDLAQGMTKLKAFVHISTAYSQCHLQHIEEKFYTPQYNPEKLIRLTECVDKDFLEHLTPILLKESPNTYIYTKAVAEELVKTYSKVLPVSVFRPSIVVATRDEPFPGWIDNMYGPTGVVVATITGIMRTLHCDPDKLADIVPVDMVVNGLIATAWKTHERNNKIETSDEQAQVFNFVSSPEKPIKWSQFFTLGMKHRLPTIHSVWHPNLKLNRSQLLHRVQSFLYHFIPAFLVDSIARAIGKRTNLMKISNKVARFGELISYFATRQWHFSNRNVQDLWQSMGAEDKVLFPFTFSEHDWETYFKNYLKGTRQYLLKDDLSTLPRATARDRRFFWLHYTMKMVFLYLMGRMMWKTAGPLCLRLFFALVTFSQSLR